MSVGTIGTLPRALAQSASEEQQPLDLAASAVVAAADDAAAPGDAALPPKLTIGGREFTLRVDQTTGHPQYAHQSEQRDQAGNHLMLSIVLDLAPDGSYTRTQDQVLSLVNGDSQTEKSVASFNAQGQQTGEVVDATTKQGTGAVTEHTVSTFAAGKETRRETDVVRTDAQTDPATKEQTHVKLTVHGTWDEGGLPITDKTIPVIDRTEEERYLSPGQGINKDTDRVLTFTRHGAGPMNALKWDENGTLIVRFNGRGGQYIEREMRVPLSAAGAPDLNNAEVIRTDDRQSGTVKGLTQARIWGGFVSNLAWFGGIMAIRSGGGVLGKALLGLSAVASGAQLVGEGHALATKRNDGSVARFGMAVYDTLMTGLLVSQLGSRGNLRGSLPGSGLGKLSGNQTFGLALGAGAVGLANNGRELLAGGVGAGAIAGRIGEPALGAALTSARGTSVLDGDWRAEPRFDAGRALLAAR